MYWADIDVADNDGFIYYRITNDASDDAATSISTKINEKFCSTFTATSVFVATFVGVTHFNGHADGPVCIRKCNSQGTSK